MMVVVRIVALALIAAVPGGCIRFAITGNAREAFGLALFFGYIAGTIGTAASVARKSEAALSQENPALGFEPPKTPSRAWAVLLVILLVGLTPFVFLILGSVFFGGALE